MGLGSLRWTEQPRLIWEEDEEEEEEGGDEEEEELTGEAMEDGAAEVAVWLAIPTNPLTRLKRGSAHRLLLQVVAGSRVKRPV